MNNESQDKNLVTEKQETEGNSFQGLFSSEKWKEIGFAIRDYFSGHEDIFKLIGFSVALTGLFLNLQSDDIHLRRLEVFFLLIAGGLITWFILKSILNLFKGKYSGPYHTLSLIPAYIGATIIYNLWTYLTNNFGNELYFYFQAIGVPLIALGLNILFVVFFKLISKVKTIQGNQLKNFFLFILNINLTIRYVLDDYNFTRVLERLFAFEFNNLFILFLFFITLWSELRPFIGSTKKAIVTESILFVFLISIPLLIRYLLPLFY